MNCIKLYIMVFLSVIAFSSYAQEKKVKHDTSKPIEILSDSLEVRKDDRVAIFTGTVEASQGEMELRSDKMTVYYKENSNKEDGGKAISKIITEGSVFMSTPEETAQGDHGLYDVDQNIMTLTGNVAVTKGGNIVKGNHLVYNMTTGQSKMISAKEGSNNKKERVRGVFVQEKTDKKQSK